MDVRILGPLEVWEGSEQFVIDSPRQRSLLALLAVHVNEVVSVDRVVDELWGESRPDSAESTVRYHVSKLRSSLGDAADRVVTRSPGYVLELPSEAIDAHRFEAMAAEGRGLIAAEPDRAARMLVDALGMWRGTALADFTYESFARAEILRLEEFRLAVLEDRIDADLASGRHVDLVGELEGLVGEYPLRERMWGQLMTALYRCGRQAEALRAYQQARDALGEIGIEPSDELRTVEERVLMQDPVLLSFRRPARRHNLPERVSSFVGREREIGEIGRLVEAHRLVTLTGVGGVGKTSVAVEAMRPLVDDFADGVWFASFADIAEADLVPDRLAHALGVQVETPAGLAEQLGNYLRQRDTLVLFDACERHIDAVADLAGALLAAAPSLRVVATSREPLEVAGEARFTVPVLDSDGAAADAIRLFTERANLVQPSFETTPDNVDVVADVCHRLAGIPLAVELAAARLGSLTLQQIADRLEDQMALLARGRRRSESHHDSLQATLDWSHDLLDPTEQTLFRRLAVFEGGFTADAAMAVCPDETVSTNEVTDLLARLVDVSLVVVDRETGRFHTLDPVRQYADRHLDSAKEADLIRRRHATYYRDVAEDASNRWWGPDEIASMATCAQEEANQAAAIAWALRSGEERLAIDTAAYLTNYWRDAGRLMIQDRLLEPVLALARKLPSRESVILLAHAAFAYSANVRIEGDAATVGEEALWVAEQLGDEFAIGHALLRLATVVEQGRGVDYARRAMAMLDRIGHPQAIQCGFNLALTLCSCEDETGELLDEAEALAEHVLAQAAEIGSLKGRADGHRALGYVAMYRGDLSDDRTNMANALLLFRQRGDDRWIAMVLAHLAMVEYIAGDIRRAAAYCAEGVDLFRETWGGEPLVVPGLIRVAQGDAQGGIDALLGDLRLVAPRQDELTSEVFFALGLACAETEHYVITVQILAVAEALRSKAALALPKPYRQRILKLRSELQAILGNPAFNQAWKEGAALSVDDAVAYAVRELGTRHRGEDQCGRRDWNPHEH